VVGQDAPILLIHSLQDEYTPPSHSEDIFANSNQAHTVLHLTDWGAAHGESIFDDYEAYRQLFDEFLVEQAPDFGLSVETP